MKIISREKQSVAESTGCSLVHVDLYVRMDQDTGALVLV
jgi:hypothetical protein